MMNIWTLWLVIFTVLTGAQHVTSQSGKLKLASVIVYIWPGQICLTQFWTRKRVHKRYQRCSCCYRLLKY